MTSPSDPERRYRWAVGSLLALGAAVMFATLLDYGLSWDEQIQATYAEHLLLWYQTGGQHREALSFLDLHLYGGFFELLAQSVGRVFPFGVYEGRHAVIVAFGLAGVWATARLGSLVGGARAGFLAALFLLATPLYYGHSFFNSKDVPFAVVSAWLLVALFRSVKQGPPPPWKQVLIVGLLFGLVLGVRAGGIFHWGYAALFWGAALVADHAGRQDWRGLPRNAGRVLGALGLVLAVAWGVMLVFWPFGQVRPFHNPIFAMREAARFDWDFQVLFDGRLVDSDHTPWTYVPIHFGVGLPEFYFLGWLAGVLAVGIPWLRGRGRPSGAALADAGMLLFVIVFPAVLAVVLGSTLYDGVRHLLFLVPPMAVLAGWGLSTALDALGPGWARRGLWGLTALLVGAVGVEMVRLHPYQHVYFNQLFAGGLPGAQGRFETDYWGTSYREAAEWVFEHYDVPEGADRKIRVWNCSNPVLHDYFLTRSPEWSERFESGLPPDICLATTRWNCHEQPEGRLLHVVERRGVGLVYVFELPDVPRTDREVLGLCRAAH